MGSLVAKTGPVLPVDPMMSATKTFPELFGAVRSAIVAVATWKMISVLNLSDAPPPHVVQAIPKPKVPVPSPLKAPVCAAKVLPGLFWLTVMSPKTTPVALNLKASKSADPVFTNAFVPNRSTSTSTVVPFWVSVTLPNGGVPHPPVQWSPVRLNTTA